MALRRRWRPLSRLTEVVTKRRSLRRLWKWAVLIMASRGGGRRGEGRGRTWRASTEHPCLRPGIYDYAIHGERGREREGERREREEERETKTHIDTERQR